MAAVKKPHRIGITRIDEEQCTGCRECVDSCMMDVIYFNETTEKAFPKYADDCQACFLCVRDCPVDAITIAAVD